MTERDRMREAESIELAALCALHCVADAPLRDRLGLRLEEVGDGIASVAGALPASAITINRMLGLGRARPPQVADVRAAVDLYRGAGVERFFVQPDPRTSDERIARLPSSAGWHAFMAFSGDTPAGTGALYISGKAAFTDFGATAPDFRGRGAQTANLAHRVRVALETDCTRVHTCTGVAVASDPQQSYANILKCGFRESHVRAAWQPARRRFSASNRQAFVLDGPEPHPWTD